MIRISSQAEAAGPRKRAAGALKLGNIEACRVAALKIARRKIKFEMTRRKIKVVPSCAKRARRATLFLL
jgi:hypothetical protein